MKPGEEFLLGAKAERAVISAWLRKYTNLNTLAQLVDDDVCSMTAAQQAAYCEAREIKVKGGKI